jgi:RNA polymerase sigma-70 factor, ECF subfamily
MSKELLTIPSASTLSDEQVVERVLTGETALYEVIMRRYNTRLYRVARSILRNDTEAEDVMQDAYVRAYQHLDQFAGRSKFSTWLTRIAVHGALARVNKGKRFEEWDDMNETEQHTIEAAQPKSDPEAEAASSELTQILEATISRLPPQYRSVVMLRDVEELSTSEAADCLSITEDNVKVRLHRAHGLLRKELLAKAKISAKELFPFHATRCDRIVAAVFARIAT